MSDVKWIKLVVGLFDDEKILFIESMPDADSIIIIWIKLLCLAGKQNNKGVVAFNGIPYTPEMLSTIFRRDETVITNALSIFEQFGMVQTVKGTITITNWGKHQTLDKIEAHTEYMRNYMREYRSKQKAIASGDKGKPNGKSNSKPKIRATDEELEIEVDKKQDIDIETDVNNIVSNSPDYNSIIKSFTSICKSLPKAVKLTSSRKTAIDIAIIELGGTSFEQFFMQIENSDFLAGRVKDWQASFDWIMKPENIVKILSGKYNNREPAHSANYSDRSRYENLSMEV